MNRMSLGRRVASADDGDEDGWASVGAENERMSAVGAGDENGKDNRMDWIEGFSAHTTGI